MTIRKTKRQASVIKFGSKEGKAVNMTELAEILGSDRKTVQRWLKEGLPVANQSGNKYEFDTAKCILWRLQKTLDEQRDIDQAERDAILNHFDCDMPYEEARRRGEVARALKAELDLEKERETLANIDDILRNVASSLTIVGAKLNAMPSRLAGDLSHRTENEVETILNSEVRDILTELSQYQHKYH